MNQRESTSYRVKFPGGSGHQLAGIIDRPKDWVIEAGPVVVYSHCFTCNKDLKSTVRISRALAKHGVAVLRYDMTGLGGSEGSFSQTNFTTNLADLRAAVQFAGEELGPVSGLVGHSFGGIASLVVASEWMKGDAPLPLQPLCFVATLAAPSDTQHLAELLSRMNPEIESQGEGEVTIGGITWNIHRQMLDDFRRHDVTKHLHAVDCPVLLLHSPVDETVGIDHALRLMSLMQTGRESDADLMPVSLVSLPGSDHLLANNPSDVKFVARLLAAWCHRYA